MAILAMLRLELAEIIARRGRYLSYLVVAAAAVLLAGALAVRTPSVAVLLFTAGIGDEQVATLEQEIEAIGDMDVAIIQGPYDLQVLRASDAGFAVANLESGTTVTLNTTSSQYALALPLARAAARAIANLGPDDEIETANLAQGARPLARSSLLPRETRTQFIPRVIALLSIYMPFLIAFEAFVWQSSSGALLVQLAAFNGRLGQFIVAKFAAATLSGLVIFSLLLLVANAVFGIAPKHGLLYLLLIYAGGCGISAALGLVAATIAGGSRQLVSILAAYFFALIAFSGFVWPLAAAEDFVQLGAYLLPLRYPLAAIERWAVAGLSWDSVSVGSPLPEPMAFALLGVAAIVLLWFATERARRVL